MGTALASCGVGRGDERRRRFVTVAAVQDWYLGIWYLVAGLCARHPVTDDLPLAVVKLPQLQESSHGEKANK